MKVTRVGVDLAKNVFHVHGVDRKDQPVWRRRLRRSRWVDVLAETVAPGGIVFLGSSHLEWFDTKRFLPGYRIVNRAIASDRLGIGDRGILRRLDISVFDCRPSFVVLQNGINDLGELARTGAPPLAAILAAYERVVTAIRERLPDVPLCLVNEMPTTGRFSRCNPYVLPFNEHVRLVFIDN